ncbi:MAG: type III pantothenate kinase [Bacillota bacterium]
MLLVVDVGNTNVVLGLFHGAALARDWRIATDRAKTVDEYGILFKNLFAEGGFTEGEVDGAVLSSVVPPLTMHLSEMCRKYLSQNPLLVEPGVKTGLSIKYDNPREVGADRIVNAVAAIGIYGAPAIVVDFGTATTFCAISAKKEYLGGAIAPGIGISSEALFQRAAKLPRVELAKPPGVIGRNTIQSIQAGIIYGFTGQVKEVVRRIKEEMGGAPRVIATGGLAELIAGEAGVFDVVDPHLTLQGLRIIFDLNRS